MWKKVNRNWGHYIVLLSLPFFKVKLLHFLEGGRLSFQFHRHRKEMWFILDGEYKSYLEGLTSKSKFLFVREGEIHSFKAFTKTNVIELQFGSKVDEDDIIRLTKTW